MAENWKGGPLKLIGPIFLEQKWRRKFFQADGIPKFRFQKRFLFCKQMGVSENGGGKGQVLGFFFS